VSAQPSSRRLLDPVERAAEILFGLIMVLTFTSSISVASEGDADVRTVMAGAIGCNLAWGLVDATMYLMANFMARARGLATVRAVREAVDPETADGLIRGALPPIVARVLRPAEVEAIRQRLTTQTDLAAEVPLSRPDYLGAVGIFLLVFLSTLPVVVPFIVIDDLSTALRTSNAIAALLLFATGWSLGRAAGRPGWRAGLGTLSIGIALVMIAIALGG
jgi:VIT family